MIEAKQNELSDYGKYHFGKRLGFEARYRGKVICKAQAYQIEKAGMKSWLEWHEKPGWDKGVLTDEVLYHNYLKKQLFL